MRQHEQRAVAAHGGAPALACRCRAGQGGLVHAAPDQEPRQRRQHGQQHKTAAPTPLLHQPGQRRAGEQQAQPAHAHAHARQKCKARSRKMPRNEHRAGQKGGRAAHANEQLPQHQPAVVGCPGRHGRAGNGQRKGAEQCAAQAIQVHADAHEKLRHAKRQTKQPGKRPQRRWRKAKVALQARSHDGGDGAVGLAQRKGREQRQQHEPQRGLRWWQGCHWRGRRRVCGGGVGMGHRR